MIFPNSGVGHYTLNILREFASQSQIHSFFLYCHRPFNLGFPLPDHWAIRTGAMQASGRSTLFAQSVFPVWSLRDRLDVFWSPRNQLPLLLLPWVRKVITMHDLVWKRFPETMARGPMMESLLSPPSIWFADRILANSEFTRSELLAHFPHAEKKTDVIYHASNAPNTRERQERQLACPYFLFVGSNEPRKNIKRMLLAYLEYRKMSAAPIDFVMIGTLVWGKFDVQAFLRENGLEQCVHLIRGVDNEVLCSYYAYASALVLVSLYEGFGVPLVEAMQWGIPIVASRNSAVVEIAGEAGLLVDPYDIGAIAGALRQITEDEEMRERLARTGRNRGREFSWEKTASATLVRLIGPTAHAENAVTTRSV
jgi:glycosyltransferase involved in cell wall biosynthesis